MIFIQKCWDRGRRALKDTTAPSRQCLVHHTTCIFSRVVHTFNPISLHTSAFTKYVRRDNKSRQVTQVFLSHLYLPMLLNFPRHEFYSIPQLDHCEISHLSNKNSNLLQWPQPIFYQIRNTLCVQKLTQDTWSPFLPLYCFPFSISTLIECGTSPSTMCLQDFRIWDTFDDDVSPSTMSWKGIRSLWDPEGTRRWRIWFGIGIEAVIIYIYISAPWKK